MPTNKHICDKFDASYKLLSEETTTFDKFESVRRLIHGYNPRIDRHLEKVSKAFNAYKKLHDGEVIQLTAEHLPEKTDRQKKRKRALLLLLESWTQLKGEVERVRSELHDVSEKSLPNQAVSTAKIIKLAKGPFGLITLAAIAIVTISAFAANKAPAELPQTTLTSPTNPIVSGSPTTYIIFQNKKISVTELVIRDGPDCGSGGVPHYHAANGAYVTAIDSTQVPDPGACAYGKVSETEVISE